MKILSLRVEQFKKFDQAVLVDGFGDGLNLVAGPNETGKSTLLLALRAVLFERHGAKTQAVKDFSPHKVTGARPTITLTFEIGGERYVLEKRFLKGPAATLETSGGERFEGSDAESELKRLLGLDPAEKTSVGKDAPAHFGVLLTPQARSFDQPELADGTRHSLEAAIARDIAELGNQSEVDGLLAAFDGILFDVVSKRGEPKNRYKDVVGQRMAIEHEIAEATAERVALHDQLDQLDRAIAERRELASSDDGDRPEERLASLEAERTRAARLQALENRRLGARQRLQAAEAKRAAHRSGLEERRRLADEIATIENTADEAKARLASAEETIGEQEKSLAALDDRQQRLAKRRRALETLGRKVERLGQIETTLRALATDVRLELEERALERVTIDGEPAAATHDLRQVTEGVSIEIEGVGRIGIEPKIEPMREALAAKAAAEGEIGDLSGALDLDDDQPETIDAALRAVAEKSRNLEVSRAEIEPLRTEARRHAAEAKAALDASIDRRAGLVQRLAEIDSSDAGDVTDPTALEAEIAEAKAALDAAEAALEATARSPETGAMPATVEALDGEIEKLRARIERRRRAMDEAGKKVLALESAIAVRSGLGLDEKIDQLERQHHLLTQERDAFALDHRALDLLQSTLRAASDEAKATFNAPLSARLAPYIQDLFPGATPVVTPDFSIRAIDRNGVEEPFLQLSDGTREQIAILARLAYADMLQEYGLPALIVLDDALAFSDDRRLERMVAILEKAATRMQVVILTCRENRFAGIEATRLDITSSGGRAPSVERTSSAA